MSNFGIGPADTYNVTSVDIGIENANDGAGAGQPVTIRLYQQTSGTFPGGTRVQIGTTTATVQDQTLTVLNIPITASVPAGTSQMVMEVFTPDGQVAMDHFIIGSNSLGQSDPGYISAAACGFPDPTDLTTLGFPNMHMVMNVNGSCPAAATPTPTATATPTNTPTATPTETPCPMTVLPNNNATSTNSQVPSTGRQFSRAVYLVRASELAAAGFSSGTSPTTIGWNYASSTGVAGSAPLLVYMQNTSDTANNKTGNWATDIAGMTTVHNATTAVPGSSGTFDIALTGGSPFTYTGGGLYIAYDWGQYTGTTGVTSFWCSTTLSNGLWSANTNAADLTIGDFRPETRLGSSLCASPTPTATATATPTATSTPNITGNVDYAIVSKPVPDTQLLAAGSPPLLVFSDSMGNYALSGFGPGAYTVTPSRTAQPCLPAGPNGIFSNDAALISQHVVSLITLTPDQLIAADVSGFHAISSFDAALIAQKVVGICGGLNHSGEWVFSPSSVDHPGGVIGSLTENYRAVMIGDVSGDWSPIGPRPAEPIRRFGVPDVKASVPVMKAAAGAEVVIPFRIDDLGGIGVGSYQFDLIYDPSVITPADAAASIAGTMDESLTIVSNSPLPGLLKVAVYGAVPVYGDGVYVYLRFKVTGNAGTATPLQLRGFRLNDASDATAVKEGRLIIEQ